MPLPNNLYSREQVRELDRIAIEDFSIDGFSLMKRAAKASYDALLKHFEKAQKILVVCGTGNNGGDGYLVAYYALKDGYDVSVLQMGNPENITGDALSARKTFEKWGGVISSFDINQNLPKSDVIVDAIFGTGLDRDIEGDYATVIESINKNKAQVLALDIPSGLHANSGAVLGCCVEADLSVTFIGLKKGLFTAQARDYCGEIIFDDLAVPREVYSRLESKVEKTLLNDSIISKILKPRKKCSHKGDAGHVLLIGGVEGMSGAIRLAGEASLRTGAGLVTIATHPAHANVLNLDRPELMVQAVTDASALVPLIDKADVIAIGPGLGQTDWGQSLFNVVVNSDKPKVLDADALNLLSKTNAQAQERWVLTPHPAEAARLLRVNTADIETDRYANIGKIAKKWGGVILLKGAGSLVSDGNHTYVSNAGNPGMASGGMGDVLTGIIASLIAQGLSNLDAARVGMTIHANAGDLAAENGERGLIASDLLPFIRKLVNNHAHD